uniref:T-box transcription factor TBX6-like isoform X1 n=1 Tax=Styela clava TaxID=7725 RepID=UPI00193A3FBE|nr:T-box transcription factor TBX6-like isoform X1 [Styela clava]
MAEVAYGNFQYQGYPAQGLNNIQQFNHGVVPNGGYVHPGAGRYNPYQRPSPPMPHVRNRQSPPLMAYKPAQMVNRHQQGMHGWNTFNNNIAKQHEDYNANSQPITITNGNWQHGNWIQQQRNRASPPIMQHQNPTIQQPYGQSTSPVVQGMPNPYDQVATMRRRMSSSSQSSDYGATPGMQGHGNDNRWMVSPSPTGNTTFPNNQFQQQHGGFNGSQVSPNPGAIPAWNSNPSHPYSTPSPMSSISSENSSPPPMVPFVQPPQPPKFRHPASVHPSIPGIQPPIPQIPRPPQVPIVPSDVPPGTTTGTSGNDWEVNCLGAKVKLRNSDLWKNFESVVMEMVISKHGRRMFPVLEYDVKGLHPQKLYSVFVDFVLANKYVWKFSEQKWNPSGLAPEEDFYDKSHRVCLHPDSPASGDVWNKRGVSFSKMKLSNHLHSDSDKLSLKSLHKYQPRLHVVEVDPRDPSIQTNLRTFIIPKTQFMTVTLYHNTDVAQLKINLNPFARCFRDKDISPRSVESAPSPSDKNEPDSSRLDDVTSPWNQQNSDATIANEPQAIIKVENPVEDTELQRAKHFMQQQLNTMTQLVRAQDALSTNQSSTTIPTIDTAGIDVKTEENNSLANVDFDRELEGLLSNMSEGKDTTTQHSDPSKKTVHHFGPSVSSDIIKTPSAKRLKTNNGNPLDKYELLNVDRCFPPNAIAPLSNTLPFDLARVKTEALSKGGANTQLPTFFRCSYYQEQAAQQANTSTQNKDSNSSLPVIYIPKSTTTITSTPSSSSGESSPIPGRMGESPGTASHVMPIPNIEKEDILSAAFNATNAFSTSPIVKDDITDATKKLMTSPAPSASSPESMTQFNPCPLPTLSPNALQQFLDADINDMMSGNKRKCSFDDDIDDDVFGGSDETSLMNACDIFNPQNQQFLPSHNFFVEQK